MLRQVAPLLLLFSLGGPDDNNGASSPTDVGSVVADVNSSDATDTGELVDSNTPDGGSIATDTDEETHTEPVWHWQWQGRGAWCTARRSWRSSGRRAPAP